MFNLTTSKSDFNKSCWGCFRATLALVAASVGLAACATVAACGIAVTSWLLAYDVYKENCLNHQ